jgi:sulfide:quinone oxidoreductase
MKKLVIVGAGTAGTTVANAIEGRLPQDWSVTIIDPEEEHLYQPDLIFLPFGMQEAPRMVRPRKKTLKSGVEWLPREVISVDPDSKRVILDGDEAVGYDLLVIASGSHIHPEETPGLLGETWQQNIFDYYTLDGASKLRDALAAFEGGRVALNVVEMPIKCPVAPLEFLFLAEDYFNRRGIRDQVDL